MPDKSSNAPSSIVYSAIRDDDDDDDFFFCGVVDRRKGFSLISSQDHSQRSSPSLISNTPRAGFEPAQA